MYEVQQFNPDELTTLRQDLRHAGLDSFQAADLLTTFLAVRGYGSSQEAARGAAARLELAGCTVPCIQAELEAIALFM